MVDREEQLLTNMILNHAVFVVEREVGKINSKGSLNVYYASMKKILSKETAELGLKWSKHQEAKFDNTPINEIDKWEYRHVQKLSKDFHRSLKFHASL